MNIYFIKNYVISELINPVSLPDPSGIWECELVISERSNDWGLASQELCLRVIDLFSCLLRNQSRTGSLKTKLNYSAFT